jgi:hypothetical protein
MFDTSMVLECVFHLLFCVVTGATEMSTMNPLT